LSDNTAWNDFKQTQFDQWGRKWVNSYRAVDSQFCSIQG